MKKPGTIGLLLQVPAYAAFAAFIRVFLSAFEPFSAQWAPVVWVLAAATMIASDAVMQDGKLVEFGTREQILTNPQQMYTKRLLAAVPSSVYFDERAGGDAGAARGQRPQ